MTRHLWSLLLSFAVTHCVYGAEPDFSQAPGTVVAHTPASSGIYYGSAGIAALGNGVYLTKCDEFGPGTTEHQRAVSIVFRSEDRGATWKRVARIDGLFWASVFTYGDAVYLLGMEKHHGRIVIMRSDDHGDHWTTPDDGQHGLLTDEGQFHTAPMPLISHQGRLWRAVEDAMGGTRWGERYRARMLSIPLGADLLVQENWTLSEPLARNAQWMDGQFGGWLEGNAVATPKGEIVNILRIACRDGGKAAVVRVSEDGKRLEFDPARDIIDLPGGSKKFVIRYDEQSKAYWTLANPVMPCHAGLASAASIRNALALMRSDDLRSWQVRCLLLYHPDIRKHGFQYPDWLFEGDDLIAAIRTAYDDGLGGAHNAHDANFLTFHRFANFRELTMADSVVDPASLGPAPKTEVQVGSVSIEGRRFSMATLDNDSLAFANRTYTWQEVPAAFRGWQYTQTSGGEQAEITVTAKAGTTLFVATTAAFVAGDNLHGWQETGDSFHYTDRGRTQMVVLRRVLSQDETLKLPQGSWTSTLLLVPPAKEEPSR